MNTFLSTDSTRDTDEIARTDSMELGRHYQVINECVIVPIREDLTDFDAIQVQRAITDRIYSTGARGLVIDVSSINVIDSFLAQMLDNTGKIASLLGVTPVLVGLQPEVVATVIDLDYPFESYRTVRTLQQGLDLLDTILRPDVEAAEVERNADQIGGHEEVDENEEQNAVSDGYIG